MAIISTEIGYLNKLLIIWIWQYWKAC